MSSSPEKLPVLVGMTSAEITEWVTAQGEKPFRGRQIAQWLYQKHVTNAENMSDLSKAFRQTLQEKALVSPGKIVETVKSADGTTKFLIELQDGEIVECVTIVQKQHLTACVSSQVGCNVGCPFCATGLSGFRRNLTAGEIVIQYLLMQQAAEAGLLADHTPHTRIGSMVFMGMGEPLLNYDAVLSSMQIFNKEIGLGMRHMTISTSGIIPGIERLMKEPVDYNLAISLHSVKTEVRNRLVPINRKYGVNELLQAAKLYANRTGRRITFEYTLLQGINDSAEDAKALIKALRGIHCHINLIAYNPVKSAFQAPPRKEILSFQFLLTEAGFPATIRHNHGQADMAACGQLRVHQREKDLQVLN
ncbi:23S rRNA (adenine(2503)-C(2))-methyltransferase RlmN [bacterium (Candidatus Blackallbacteria) CG17_big_fil_post_rev_8_21_14_2_50_48_46]|uniref:Probable dual-specificity RNA methyltransferase RlmN n=1 Tax=bacterium (Candidatus Blackallbacteria) CG17_big_fil_post_rev_8_21_14_2_50_48_46 TaxID=2014261 RepID=A0A2M7GBE9_9BACT|nr:MAG: 23S rRNA (adenine(2503)-C(2))-methyltransferase RlmN [bacterium (Candidatus Blackallbacteria) CG18_big_fil_WC_8_21_14_2_50_49_26]PIW19519.1 MAG: 23S rRNA (adenine(2503)-C(2))-methyltransferase RlmN [bacterium (Candidatus Blackallbacteria) CG17_big_fil_post_rev_8_21_14_2_50_48_46]PIW48877.1 MAG: 23S rRNA (adenine(2503)-C(2))-methyltransferase RlmN [bacterium (Candidatus Blackallbacteria) CG13_big_fil_rev_8_21_14_2_50_49_14]